jgi:hypothetical protein
LSEQFSSMYLLGSEAEHDSAIEASDLAVSLAQPMGDTAIQMWADRAAARVEHHQPGAGVDAIGAGNALEEQDAVGDLLAGARGGRDRMVGGRVDLGAPELVGERRVSGIAALPSSVSARDSRADHGQEHFESRDGLDGVGLAGGKDDRVARAERKALSRDRDLGRAIEHMDEGVEGDRMLAELLTAVEREQGHVPGVRLGDLTADDCGVLVGGHVGEAQHLGLGGGSHEGFLLVK